MAPLCATFARSCNRTTIPSTSCDKESSVQATTRRIVLSGLVLGSSTHPLKRRATTQAAAAMPGKLIDAHVHVWAGVEDARSGKFPYYVSPACVCGRGAPSAHTPPRGRGEGSQVAGAGVRHPGHSSLRLLDCLPCSYVCFRLTHHVQPIRAHQHQALSAHSVRCWAGNTCMGKSWVNHTGATPRPAHSIDPSPSLLLQSRHEMRLAKGLGWWPSCRAAEGTGSVC